MSLTHKWKWLHSNTRPGRNDGFSLHRSVVLNKFYNTDNKLLCELWPFFFVVEMTRRVDVIEVSRWLWKCMRVLNTVCCGMWSESTGTGGGWLCSGLALMCHSPTPRLFALPDWFQEKWWWTYTEGTINIKCLLCSQFGSRDLFSGPCFWPGFGLILWECDLPVLGDLLVSVVIILGWRIQTWVVIVLSHLRTHLTCMNMTQLSHTDFAQIQ